MTEGYDSVFRPDLFAGQTVLITGGGTGIGRCTAHELACLGATVVIAGRREEVLQQTREEIEKSGGRCDIRVLNIRDDEQIEAVVASVVAEYGRIDGLVNNAGGQFVAPAEKISPKGWRTVIDLILNGTFLVSRAVFNHSMQQHGGAIVNMLADIWTGYPWMSHMAAARAGLDNLAISLALEWSSSGVRINAVAPGTILSSGMLTYPPEVQQITVDGARNVAADRLGTESEVSAAIVFLLSPAAAYITGETIRIDGGSGFDKGRFIRLGGHGRCKPFHGFHLRPDYTGTPFDQLDDD